MSPADHLASALDTLQVPNTERILVAVSGGVDSVTLMHLLAEHRQPIVVAHVDHGLRKESAGDAAFVGALAESLGAPFVPLAVSVDHGNVQARAREARYEALADCARQQGIATVATAHTATDQAETVLMSLVRGAGLRGLAGMPDRRALAANIDLIRPLLHCSRTDVISLARQRGWRWQEDPSNAGSAFLRNRIRHDVLPHLRAEGGVGTDRRIAEAASRARSGVDVVQVIVGRLLDGQRVDLDELRRYPHSVRGLLLAEAMAVTAPEASRSAAFTDRLVALVDADVGRRVVHGLLSVWRERDALRIEWRQDSNPPGRLTVHPLARVPERFEPSANSEVIDADRAADPTVRFWQDGDRIAPLGMDGSRLVSDLLRERGVPRADRQRVPVVEVGGEVAWVIGHRLSRSVAITDQTARAVRWTWTPDAG
ncbi:MAG: tRNA lysidine(34) synthetase TilS [Bacteroidota bacterium]